MLMENKVYTIFEWRILAANLEVNIPQLAKLLNVSKQCIYEKASRGYKSGEKLSKRYNLLYNNKVGEKRN